MIPGHRWWEPREVPGLEPYQGGEEAGGRWARELVWALVWVGKRGARQGGCLLWESGCKNGDFGEYVCGSRPEKKRRFLSDAAQRLDPPAITAPRVTAEIILGMTNMEQASPQDTWTPVIMPVMEMGQLASLWGVSGIYRQCFRPRRKLP